jgi:hypothetical protein
MKTRRDLEVNAILSHDRAVEVANLLLGKLNGPLRSIFPAEYYSMPRRNLRSGKASLRDGRADEIEQFCETNVGTRDVGKLARLYEPLFQHDSRLRLPLKEFAALIGQPQDGVLRGAPRHSTIAISSWGLQTEYPEMHLVRDMLSPSTRLLTLKVKTGGTKACHGQRQNKTRFGNRLLTYVLGLLSISACACSLASI